MLTPLDIENKKFSKQMMNGYSVNEVDEFLDELTADYEKLYKETMSDEVIGTRGSRVLNLGSSEIDINKESFLIYE